MESPSPLSRYIPQNSKKRVFPGGSSTRMEADVVEISPPRGSRSSGAKSLKRNRKEVHFREIIDVDLDEDGGDVVLIGETVVPRGKGKGILDVAGQATWTSLGPSNTNHVLNDSVLAPSVAVTSEISSMSTSTKVTNGDPDEEIKRLQPFKKFDTVEDFSDHYYYKHAPSVEQPSKNWTKKIQDEWRILEKDLPDSIFVRVYESRMDLLRAVIMGAEGTPYHDGLFFFDVFFPSNYPSVPPKVNYHSGGLRINPNLYNCGKVCLSLLNTWSGSQKEKWLPRTSTMLQVLVSIQGLILNAKPYFNEPGYASMSGSPSGEKSSLQYNENTFILSLKTMLYNIRRPPKHFEDIVARHFCNRAHGILVACQAYIDGAQVGCLAKGGVQDVDEGDKSCSKQFRRDVASFIKKLVDAFKQVGAKNCEKFLPLAQKPKAHRS